MRCATRSRAAWCSGPGAAPATTVELQVIDTGPGITPENRSAIFEEFRRLDQPSPWGEKGLGLGLSICERIAAILDSTLTLESTPGRGSIFGIRVPRAGAGAAASFSELTEHKIGRAEDACLECAYPVRR